MTGATGAGTGAAPHDPLHVLREYRSLAPWNLHDLTALVGAVLDASAITPINAAARAQPSERTIRSFERTTFTTRGPGRACSPRESWRASSASSWCLAAGRFVDTTATFR